MKAWILSVFATSLMTAIGLIIAPKAKKAVSLAGGLLIILTAISPVAKLTYLDISRQIAKLELKADALSTGVNIGSSDIMAVIIQEKAQAYILDKAALLGLDVSVTVQTETASDGWPYPAAVSITGVLSEADRLRLGKIISEDLAIEPKRQEWS